MCVEYSCGGNRHRRDAMWPLLSLGLERWAVTFASRTAFTWPPSTQRPGCMKMSLGQAAWASKKCSRCIWLTTLCRPRSTRRFSVGAWKTLWSMILPGAIATSKDVVSSGSGNQKGNCSEEASQEAAETPKKHIILRLMVNHYKPLNQPLG